MPIEHELTALRHHYIWSHRDGMTFAVVYEKPEDYLPALESLERSVRTYEAGQRAAWRREQARGAR